MKLYRKEIMVKDWGYDDFSSGKVILDWTREEDFKGIESLHYRFTYKIFERYIEIENEDAKEKGIKNV